jgi:hypothetical protein
MNVSAAPQQQQVAVNSVPVRGTTTGNASLNTNVAVGPGRNTGTGTAVAYTNCTRCQNGYAQGNRVTNGDCTTLGAGWMNADPGNQGIWIDPCFQPTVSGCMDPAADNFNPSATMSDGSCSYPVDGCMDSTANNFNSLATVSDGSCTFTETDEEIEKKADIIEDLVADTQTAGLGDSKIIMYLGIGILAYFLLKGK